MEPAVAVVRLDGKVRHALLDRVDDHVGELSDHLAIRGPNGLSQVQPHADPTTGRSGSIAAGNCIAPSSSGRGRAPSSGEDERPSWIDRPRSCPAPGSDAT